MCGIAALIGGAEKPELERNVTEMLNLVSHRGPDGRGVLSGDGIALGHVRLSIIDLSSDAHQPMSRGERYSITYNGEIYNYLEIRRELETLGARFKSHSDTEVILAAYVAWGKNCLHRFNGMFAFVIWDRASKSVFVARDRFGVKPLYYWRTPGGWLAFASEIKQFTRLPGWSPHLNGQRAYDFLNWSLTDHTNETCFTGVLQIPPGGMAEISLHDRGELKPERWYQLRPATPAVRNDDQLIELFTELLTDAVRLRLRSDVPVGSCLSGGLDSTTIVSLIRGLLKESGSAANQKTFSAVFPGADIDESPLINETVRSLGIENKQVQPTAEGLSENFDKLLWHQDEPFVSTSIFAQWEVFAAAHAAGIKVMLDGQGADEQLGGYHLFFGPHLLGALSRGSFARELEGMHREHGYSKSLLVLKMLNRALPPAIRGIGRRITGRTLAQPNWLELSALDAKPCDPWQSTAIPLRSTRDLSYTLLTSLNLPMLLRYEDRNSMAHGVEARVPFLDYRLVEFVLGLPDDVKIRAGITKWILRGAMKNRIPAAILEQRRKIGFETPEAQWFANSPKEMREDINSTLLKATAYAPDLLSSYKTIDLLSPQLFRVYCFEKWRQRFNVSL